jgi:putative toxin-antitoxin system antitoxin component (TIGR02293 family)
MTVSDVKVWRVPATKQTGEDVPFHLLDGSRVIGLAHGEGPKRLRSGLSMSALDALRAWMGVPMRELAQAVGISERTLSRRRKEGERLGVGESDRVLRLARLCEMAASALGRAESGAEFMRSKHRLLGGETPAEHAQTNPGAHEVERILYAIEFTLPV